ncbi:MAG: 2-dehydropantoate 2-reductase [Burkholderiaceae bacterium]|nr:MAG: 2-dehydropantoate 2-reductase [Burkholderiaceae bacterium]MBE7427003.1 2-dehydropantoate 2-reductase [Ideonella sp.]MCC7286892.1 2-dehydropantoate 2-reductase [Burkholderiaceae bacterium]
MKIAIIGAGAIGGLLGARLALAGEDVTFVVRGANLQAIGEHGIKLIEADGREQVARNVRATNDYRAAGAHDLVVLAMKAHQLGAVAAQVPLLCGPDTVVVPMQNGIPFWYFHKLAGPFEGRTLDSVDPGGAIGRAIAPERVIGCVVYPASELVAPGVVRHIEGDRFPLGELDGSTSARAQRVSDAFVRSGLKAPLLADIRSEIWLKLWGNLVFNPVSALTRATLADICRFAPTRELSALMMAEAQQVATKLGVTFRVSIDKRIAGAERVGAHKTSMLQDVEAGREPEIEALIGSVAELARLTATPTPHIDTVYALTRLLARGVTAAA